MKYIEPHVMKQKLIGKELLDKKTFLDSAIYGTMKEDSSFWEDYLVKYICQNQLRILSRLDGHPEFKELLKNKTNPNEIHDLDIREDYIGIIELFDIELLLLTKYKPYWEKAIKKIEEKGYRVKVEEEDEYTNTVYISLL